MNRLTERPGIRIVLLLIILLSVGSARLIMLCRSSQPNGLDGAFYAMEFRSVMERGYPENPDPSPVFRMGGVLARLTGDPVSAVKLCSALLSMLLTGGMYFLLRAARPGDEGTALTAAALTGASPALAKMSVNYLNNLGGLAFAVFALGFGILFLRGKKWPHLVLFLLFALAAVLSHRVAAVYLAGIAGLYLLYAIMSRSGRIGRTLFLILLFLCLAGMAWTFRFEDYRRFTGSFSLTPILPVLSPVFRRQLPDVLLWEMTLYIILTWFSLFYCLIRRLPAVWLFLTVPFFFFPFWNLDVIDMGYRMLLSSVPAGIFLVLNHPFPRGRGKTGIALHFLFIPLIFLTPGVYDARRDPSYEKYRQVVQSVELGEDSLLIAHQGLNHIYTFEKGFRDALNYVPDFPVPGDDIWRLAYGAPNDTILMLFEKEAASGLLRPLPHGYLLIKEDLWQAYLAWEDERVAESLNNWFNPHQTRPGYIR